MIVCQTIFFIKKPRFHIANATRKTKVLILTSYAASILVPTINNVSTYSFHVT